MTWTNPTDDLRVLLSDGAADKFRYRKRVMGNVDGTNVSFKTFEIRRVNNFTTASSPIGVYINGALQNTSAFAADNPATGDFSLNAAPAVRTVVEASYYVQWFTDTELQQFLRIAGNWLSLGDNYSALAEGLRPAALKYAAAEAYQKLALRWAEQLSETFLLNDAPKDKQGMGPVEAYRKMSLDLRKEAQTVRDDFYSRSGQQLQPLFGVAGGTPSNPQPER